MKNKKLTFDIEKIPMRNLLYFVLIIFTLRTQGQILNNSLKSDTSIINNYFGIEVTDTYRWLEDSNSPKTMEWIKKQEKLSSDYFKKLDTRIYDKLLNYSYIFFDPLIKKGKYYFLFQYDYIGKTPSLYYKTRIDDVAKIIIDPTNFKENKNEIVSIKNFEISKDNKYLGVAISKNGSDWNDIHVIDLNTKKVLNDKIQDAKFGQIAWCKDGFFYLKCDSVSKDDRYLASNKNPKLYFHKIETENQNDILVYSSQKETNNWFQFKITSDENYLIIHDLIKNENGDYFKAVMYSKLDSFPKISLKQFILMPETNNNNFTIIDNIGNSFLVKTDQTAATKKIVLYNPSKGVNQGTEVIPAYKNILHQASYAAGKIICLYYLDGKYTSSVFDLKGKNLLNIPFPEGCTVNGFEANSSDNETIYFVNSFYFPSTVNKLDLNNLTYKSLGTTYIKFDHTKYETKFVKYKSSDSTEIPMFITYKKGLELNGKNPTLLYGYGGFGITLTPFFEPSTIIWMENGGIFAVPSIRGGGEQGSEWHLEGSGLKKFNGFNDFIKAANFLIDNKYTNPDKLAIEGGSNGGLLVGVAMTQKPDLFKAAIPKMGLMDMLRYDKFTVASQWISEYGVSSNEEDFINLFKYSPLHNIKKGIKYPATLAITAENDDRVPPLHTYKFIATLQENALSTNPYILKLIKNSGHSGSEILKFKIQTEAIKYSFLFDILKVDAYSVWKEDDW